MELEDRNQTGELWDGKQNAIHLDQLVRQRTEDMV